MNIFLDFVGNTLLSFIQVYAWYNILRRKCNMKNVSLIFNILILSLLITLNHIYVNNFIKGFLILVLAFFFCKKLMNLNIKKAALLTFLGQLVIIVSEALIFLIMRLLLNITATDVSNSISTTLLLDLLIAVISLIISKFGFIHKFYKWLVRITNNVKLQQIIVFVFFIVIGTNIFSTSIYFNNNIVFTMVLNSIISIIYTIIVISALNYQHKYYKINYKYKMSLEDLQTQERLIDEYKIVNHENKNQLLLIKSMTTNKKIIRYVDSLVKLKNKFDNSVIRDSLKLPQGGIRGLIYSKIIIMKENNIKYHLNVDKNLNSKKFLTINDDDIVDLCNILGVFLDNAIDETMDLKDGVININFHISENKLLITISNKHNHLFKNMKNTSTIKTTKGKDRGYGLQLVKKIIDSNKKLVNEREITKDTFTQKLILNLN